MNSTLPSQAIKTVVLMALLVVSGFCGLSYEVLYARLLGNFIGDQFAVTVASLGASTFESFIYNAIPSSGQTLSMSVLVCSGLLVLPSFLIGTSLPLFAGYVARLAPGRVFGAVYSVYNCGAAVTVLTIEFWLLRHFGIQNSILVIAALNGVTDVLLRLFMAEVAAAPPPPSTRTHFASSDLLALATAGVASAIFQLVMIKVAECFLGPFRETFALVLSIVLLGIAFGTLLTMRRRVEFGTVMITATLGLLWTLLSFLTVARTYSALNGFAAHGPFTHVLLKFGALAIIMGIPALAFGATMPVALAHPHLVTVHPEVADDFKSADYGPDELPYALLSTRVLDFVGDESAPINTLDRPELEFEMVGSREWGFPDFLKRVRDGLSYAKVKTALAPMDHFDQLDHLLYWTARFGDSQITDQWLGLAAATIPDLEQRLEEARPKRVP